jgi:hypothetical protein
LSLGVKSSVQRETRHMKVKISYELEWEPSDLAKTCHDNVVDQWLSDYDMHWMVEDKLMSDIKVEVQQA